MKFGSVQNLLKTKSLELSQHLFSKAGNILFFRIGKLFTDTI
jgi:hypothetical protein